MSSSLPFSTCEDLAATQACAPAKVLKASQRAVLTTLAVAEATQSAARLFTMVEDALVKGDGSRIQALRVSLTELRLEIAELLVHPTIRASQGASLLDELLALTLEAETCLGQSVAPDHA